MPGVGVYSCFRVAAPGKPVLDEAAGSLRRLIDATNVHAASTVSSGVDTLLMSRWTNTRPDSASCLFKSSKMA
jgi:hypothetical protein